MLCSQASVRSWAVFFGFVATGIGAALYATDCCVWKLIYIAVGFAAGVWFLDDSEEIVLDKSTNTFQASIQKIFCTACCSKSESAKLDDVARVQVEERCNKFVIVISLVNSSTFTICGSSAEIDKAECQQLVERIRDFLQLHSKSAQAKVTTVTPDLPSEGLLLPPRPLTPVETTSPAIPAVTDAPITTSTTLPSSGQTDDTSSVTSSEESFERINAADLAEFDAVIAEAGAPSSSEVVSDEPLPNLAEYEAVTAEADTLSSGEMVAPSGDPLLNLSTDGDAVIDQPEKVEPGEAGEEGLEECSKEGEDVPVPPEDPKQK